MSPDEAVQAPILGYGVCKCGRTATEATLQRFGRCGWCVIAEDAAQPVLFDGREAPVRPAPATGRRKGPRSAKGKRHDKTVEKAKAAAMRRLRDAHPEEYAVLLAKERSRRHLDPWPVELLMEAMRSGRGG